MEGMGIGSASFERVNREVLSEKVTTEKPRERMSMSLGILNIVARALQANAWVLSRIQLFVTP